MDDEASEDSPEAPLETISTDDLMACECISINKARPAVPDGAPTRRSAAEEAAEAPGAREGETGREDIYRTWLNALANADTANVARARRALRDNADCTYLYESRIAQIAAQYNRLRSTVREARCERGCILLELALYDHYVDEEEMGRCGWTNVLLPRITTTDLYFLVASTERSRAMCQPVITRGGLHPSLIVYNQDTNRAAFAELGSLTTSVVLVPFSPCNISPHGVVFMASDMLNAAHRAPAYNKTPSVANITKQENAFLIVTENLRWEAKRNLINGRRRTTRFIAWFTGVWPEPLDHQQVWAPTKNLKYEYAGIPFCLNIDCIYVSAADRREVNGRIVTAASHRVSEELRADHLPVSGAFYLTVNRASSEIRTVYFDHNPKLYFTGEALNSYISSLNEPDLSRILVRAPYDIVFLTRRHLVTINLKYYYNGDRFFLVSGLEGNDLFHVSMCLWRPGMNLRLALWCHTLETMIPQGSPIAALYCIHTTDGDLQPQTDELSFRYLDRGGGQSAALGDMTLPSRNFLLHAADR